MGSGARWRRGATPRAHCASSRPLSRCTRSSARHGTPSAWRAGTPVPREEARAALARAQEFGARWPAVDDPLIAQVRALRDDASANAERGLQRERQGDLPGAIQAYEAAVAVDPATIAARVNLIALYGRQQDWTKAAAHYDALISSGVAVPAEAHFNHGVCLAAQGRIDYATTSFALPSP